MLQGLTEGRIVHFVLGQGRCKGECRPAMVVKNWTAPFRNSGYADNSGSSNLVVFLDGSNDAGASSHERPGEIPPLVSWETSIPRLAEFAEGLPVPPRTWHWPQECPHYEGTHARAGAAEAAPAHA